MPLKNWWSILERCSKTVWSIPYVSVAFFPSVEQNFIAYRSSKLSSRPACIFEIHQLWQSGFSRVYSNSFFNRSFEPEILKIGQSSHKMYSNNILNIQESTTILNAYTKKVWKLIVFPSFYFTSLFFSIYLIGFLRLSFNSISSVSIFLCICRIITRLSFSPIYLHIILLHSFHLYMLLVSYFSVFPSIYNWPFPFYPVFLIILCLSFPLIYLHIIFLLSFPLYIFWFNFAYFPFMSYYLYSIQYFLIILILSLPLYLLDLLLFSPLYLLLSYTSIFPKMVSYHLYSSLLHSKSYYYFT